MEKLHDVRVLCFLIILIPINFQFVRSETFFIVTSSENSNCFESGSNESSLGSGHPENIDGSFSDEELPCLTLQQFVERFANNSYRNLTSITLELDAGEHSLDSTQSVFSIPSFALKSGHKAATIICSQPGVRLQLHSIEDVLISRTTFVGCEEIEISFVNQFRFENSSFQSSPNGYLILNHTINATVTGSSFTELSQRQCDIYRATMVFNNSSVLVQYCTFSNSESAIYSTHSTLAIDSCTFINNSVMDCIQYPPFIVTAMIKIMSLPQTRVTITNSDFIDNRKITVGAYEGTPLILIDGSTLLVQSNTFVSNNDFGILLQIITRSSEIIIDHNYVYNNKINSAVTYIYSSNVSTTISNNNFTDNFATILLLHVNDSTVAINDSYFYGNRGTPRYVSGAVAIGPSAYNHLDCTSNVSVMIARCTFFHPETAGYINGAAVSICVDAGPVSILQCTFINHWSYVSEYASALTIDTNSSIMIGSSTFIENMIFSGVVKIRHASSILIDHTSFLNNTKGGYGDGTLSMDVDNAVIVINESYFYGNLDAVFLVGKYNMFVIDKSSFINNVVDAYKYGGMVNASGSQTGNVVILRSNFTNNTQLYLYSTEGLYGGLHLSTNTVKIADSTFFNNSGQQCAALLMEAQDIHISNSYFQCNSAVNYSGGAICIHKGLNQTLISNSTFSHNYAKKDGGVLKMMTYDGYATINIRRSTFDNNRAGLQGGVFWTFPLDYGSFHVSDSSFINNRAGSDGGVMAMNIEDNDYSKVHSQLVITGSTFDQNRAKVRGGVFSSFTPYTYAIENSYFTSNQAGTDGGVMYVGSSKSLVRISDGSIFDFNNATSRGGVISINESRLEISNTTVFSDNLAVIGDDIIACNCDIKSTTTFIQHSYTDPSFPNCTIYGQYQVTTVTTDSHPTTNSLKPTSRYVVAMAVSIPLGFIMIVTVLTATVLACLCFRRQCLQKQYGVRRSAHHPDFVPLMNDAFT